MLNKKHFILPSFFLSHCLGLTLLQAETSEFLDPSTAIKALEICEECTLYESNEHANSESYSLTDAQEIIPSTEQPALSQNDEVIQLIETQALSQSQEEIQPALSQNEEEKKEALLDKVEEPTCQKSPHPYYVTLRHIEGNGIGYNQGYTTLEGFFRPPNPETWVPFLDVRYHFFNNGKPALNAGAGLRYIGDSRVWGMSGYYDYRKTTRQHYNQVAMGLESLGKTWDFRLNGYLPVGKKTSQLFHARFGDFEGHYLFIRQKQEFAMKGANAEVGAHINRYKNAPLYFAAGPYYLEGQGKVAWGGEVRAAADLFGCLRLEASTSYDNVFKWIGQGQVSLTIPFGRKKQLRPTKNRSCQAQFSLAKRAIQRVDRYEIIPVDRKHKKSAAIDPLTGQPYFFWFVNNTSHSNGTFESPFPTLVQAQNASSPNDVIYVYPGDGTSSGMNTGIVLQDGQKLFGAGIDQLLQTTEGKITIPAMASGLPLITNPGVANNIIVCGNNNEISGLNLFFNISAISISCSSITNTTIHNNVFFLSEPATGTGIFLRDCLGQIDITNNQMFFTNPSSTTPAGISIKVISLQFTNYFIKNNAFINLSTANTSQGILIQSSATNMGNYIIQQNQFTNMTANSVLASISGGSVAMTIVGNTMTQNNISSLGDIVLGVTTNGSLNAELSDNQWINTTSTSVPSVFINNVNASSTTCASLFNNVSDSTPGFSLKNSNSTPNSFIAEIFGNVGTVLETGTITPGICP